MSTLERLRTTLAALNLTAIDGRLEALLESASKKEPAYADFLLETMSTEADARRQRYLKTRLQLAHLPYIKTFDQFDSHSNRRLTNVRCGSFARCGSCMKRPM